MSSNFIATIWPDADKGLLIRARDSYQALIGLCEFMGIPDSMIPMGARISRAGDPRRLTATLPVQDDRDHWTYPENVAKWTTIEPTTNFGSGEPCVLMGTDSALTLKHTLRLIKKDDV